VFYLLRYRANGKQSFFSIGRHGSPWTPEMARKEAKRLQGRVVSGIDPQVEKRKQRAERNEPTEVTFGEAVELYLARDSWKPGTLVQIKHHLRSLAQPLRSLKLSEIDRRRVAQLLASIQTNSGPVSRNRTRTSISAMFTWLDKEGQLPEGFANPAAGTVIADEGPSGDRVLMRTELAEVWDALPDNHVGDIIRLLILTGQRRNEIAKLQWSEIDLDKSSLTLAPARTKNKRIHELPLAPQALAILRRWASQGGGSSRANDRHVFEPVGWDLRKKKLDNSILAKRLEADPKAKPMAHWTLHDLRRTCATGLAELGVLPHVIECILNHLSGFRSGVAAIYNRNRYLPEMRAALERWADHVGQSPARADD
jgi:integrase